MISRVRKEGVGRRERLPTPTSWLASSRSADEVANVHDCEFTRSSHSQLGDRTPEEFENNYLQGIDDLGDVFGNGLCVADEVEVSSVQASGSANPSSRRARIPPRAGLSLT